MNQKRWILNGVLIVAVAFTGWAFRSRWRDTRTHQSTVLATKVAAAPQPPFTPLPIEPPVTASTYAQIALQTLFDPSRNPTVVVEQPPPPPPPVMPPLPLCYGVMNLGNGISAIMAENEKAMHQVLHPGERVGQFKLVDVNTDEIVLEWNGQQVRKLLTDLVAAPPAQAAAPVADNTPPPPPTPVKAGPGEDTGRGFKTCSMRDGLADGAESEGYRKKVYNTPFGPACRWEPVQ